MQVSRAEGRDPCPGRQKGGFKGNRREWPLSQANLRGPPGPADSARMSTGLPVERRKGLSSRRWTMHPGLAQR